MTSNLDKASAKILVLGDSGVGKSSLIHLICHSSILSSAHWTIGCSIDVKLHDNYFLEFWDIGGSRGHRIARSFLYQDYHGVILVFDATNKKSRSNLDEWLMEVTQKTNDKDPEPLVTHNVNVPIITIATKKDLLPYGTVLESSSGDGSQKMSYSDGNSSVVNIDEGLQASQLYRRHQQTPTPFFNSFQSLSTHSQTNASSYLNAPLIGDQVIYVNTQDPLSLSVGTMNNETLNKFFKHVIDRRNKKFYNKFAI